MKYTDRYRNTPRINFSYFNEGVGEGIGQWALTTTGTPGTAVDDTINYVKTKAIKVTTASGGTNDKVILTKTLSSPLDITTYHTIRLKVYFGARTDIEKLQYITVTCMTDDSNYAASLSLPITLAKYSIIENEWNYVEYPVYRIINASGAQKVGTPVYTDINKIRVTVFSSINFSISCTVSQLILIPFEEKSKVIITFSGSMVSTITYAQPIMEALGLKGTVYVSKNLIGTTGYVTLPQLTQLQKVGWSVASSGETGADLSSMTVPQITSEINNNISYLDSNGFTASRLFGMQTRPTVNFKVIYDTIKSLVDFSQYTHQNILSDPYHCIDYFDIHKSFPGVLFTNTRTLSSVLTFLELYCGEITYNKSRSFFNFFDLTTGTPTGSQWSVSNFNSLMYELKNKKDLGLVDILSLEELLLQENYNTNLKTVYYTSSIIKNAEISSELVKTINLNSIIDQDRSTTIYEVFNLGQEYTVNINTDLDLTKAVSLKLNIKKPSGTVYSVTPYNNYSILSYNITAEENDEIGIWVFQPEITYLTDETQSTITVLIEIQ